MKGILLPGILFALVTLVNVIIPLRSAPGAFPVPLRGVPLDVGIYDPEGQWSSEAGIGIDHVFVDWNMPSGRTFAGLRAAEAHHRAVMVTLEPFLKSGQAPETFIRDVIAGDYDELISGHCKVLAQAKDRVWLRFAHEMDLENGRYPWSGIDAADYVSLYRHAIGICRKYAPNIISVWSPVGNAGLGRYYPGNDIVDVVGISLFGLQPWEEIAYGRSRRFAEALQEKYALISRYGKPISIAEFGVCGTPLYRAQWLADVLGRGQTQFPLLKSVIYFNDREPYRWPETGTPRRLSPGCDVEYPDWRLGHPSGNN